MGGIKPLIPSLQCLYLFIQTKGLNITLCTVSTSVVGSRLRVESIESRSKLRTSEILHLNPLRVLIDT